MDRAQARKAILDKFRWNMKAELETPVEGDEPYEIMDLMTIRLDKILAEIYDSGRTPAESYIINADSLDAEISMEAAAMAAYGRIHDAKTLAVLLRARYLLKGEI